MKFKHPASASCNLKDGPYYSHHQYPRLTIIMTETHDIFLRAYIISANQKKKSKRKHDFRAKWPKHALIFDTETRITVDQSLTFGVYRCCEQVHGIYQVTEEGIFYADNLPAKERKILQD